LPAGILLGLDFLGKTEAKLDWKEGWLTIDLYHQSGRFKVRVLEKEDGSGHLAAVCEELNVQSSIEGLDLTDFAVKKQVQEKLRDLLTEFEALFVGLGKVEGVEHRIVKVPELVEPYCAPRRRKASKEQDQDGVFVK